MHDPLGDLGSHQGQVRELQRVADTAASKDSLHEVALTVNGLVERISSLEREVKHRPTKAQVAVVCGGVALALLTPATIFVTNVLTVVSKG